jgi:hypothetical protein
MLRATNGIVTETKIDNNTDQIRSQEMLTVLFHGLTLQWQGSLLARSASMEEFL